MLLRINEALDFVINYDITTVNDTSANITPLHITGSFTAANKIYDGNASATVLTRSLSGTVALDAVSLSGGSATFADKTVANGKVVTLAGASLAGVDAPNYVLDSVATASANITPLGVAINSLDSAFSAEAAFHASVSSQLDTLGQQVAEFALLRMRQSA